MTPPATHRGSFSTKDASQDSPPKTSLSPSKKSLFGHELDQKSVFLATLASAAGPAVARLWTVYDQAKEEFFSSDQNSTKKQATARFLRDTAENTLQYLQDKAVDPQLLGDIETTLNVAQRATNVLHGGRKRKFDEQAPNKPTERNLPVRTTGNGPQDWEHGGRLRDGNHGTFEQLPRGEFAGHARALGQHQRWTQPTDMSQGRRNAVRELFPEDQGPKRKRKNQQSRSQPGRGHSKIPFGYSRPVDSYHPDL